MSNPVCTVIVPNFRTPELTRLCLRLFYRNSDLEQVRMIVVDNDSADDSLAYLRTLPWIKLLERHDLSRETGPEMHARALDLALAEVTTPYVMVMHTDTLMVAPGWLDFLLKKLNTDPHNGGVGSWKLEHVSAFKQWGKKIEDVVRKLLGRKVKQEERYFRSHCALYRTEAVKRDTNGFFDHGTAGASLFKMLAAKGWQMPFLAPRELERYILHLNHATMILNPSAADRKTASPAARRRLKAQLEKLDYRRILADDSLDGRV